MTNILITGGPVHAYLDNVKIITNRFKGGLMVGLADKFTGMAEDGKIDVHVTYLCSESSKHPPTNNRFRTIVYHDGIDDYMEKVLELAPTMDAVVLGAAVANLIPKNKIQGKFPSHNYKEGDIIPIDFTIAPRVIDRVKKVAPNTHLFGFKLLSDVRYDELIRAAYGVLLESRAVTVFANDTMDLMQKYAVTKERGVRPLHNNDVPQWILDRVGEKYYRTSTAKTDRVDDRHAKARDALKKIIDKNMSSFLVSEEGFVFGSAAMIVSDNGQEFVTTARGKNEAATFAYVLSVDHDDRKVICGTTKKATLNAPLFEWMFTHLAGVNYILHFHYQRDDLATLEYATPGTDKDSIRSIYTNRSFNIKGHGCILVFDKEGNLLK